MNVLSRLFGRREARSEPMPPDSLYNLVDGRSPFEGTGQGYGEAGAADQIATAQACVNVISSSLSSLPPRVYRTDAAGVKTEVMAGPYAALFRRPHPALPWCDVMQWLTSQLLTFGNGLLAIEAGPDGLPTALVPIPWPGVNVLVLASGQVVYDIPTGTGGTRRLLSGDVVHIRDRTGSNPLIGVPRLARCPQVVQAALAAQTFALQIHEHGATPSGIVSLPRSITADGVRRAEAAFNNRQNGTRRVLFVDQESTYTPLNITLENSQNLESRKYSAEEIARVFGVPAVMVGINDHSTFTNSITLGRYYSQHCLAPLALKIETALGHALFAPDSRLSLELDMTSLQRGSDLERYQCWEIALRNSVLSPADVRQAEGWSGPPPPVNQSAPPDTPPVAAEPTQPGQVAP